MPFCFSRSCSPAAPAAARPSAKCGTVSEAAGSRAGLGAEAGLGSLGKPFPPARAHAAASQRAPKHEHQISSKAVILAAHLLPGRGFGDAGSAGCSVSGWQEDVSRRKEKLEVFLLTLCCLKSSSQLQTALADVLHTKQLKYPASALDKLPSNCSQENSLGWPGLDLLTPNHLSTEPLSRDFYLFPPSLLQIWGNLN